MIERSLTIGIPTFNRIKAITSCMEFLENKNLPEGIEILVIDNNSPDGTFEFLSKRDGRDWILVFSRDFQWKFRFPGKMHGTKETRLWPAAAGKFFQNGLVKI